MLIAGCVESALREAKVLLFDRPLAVADELHQAVVKDGLSPLQAERPNAASEETSKMEHIECRRS